MTATASWSRKKARDTLLPALMFILIVGLWWLMVTIFNPPSYLLPSPQAVIASYWTSAPLLWDGLQVTGTEILVGFGLAVAISIPLAIAIVAFQSVENTLMPLLVLLQTVPKVALAPLFVVWFGFDLTSKVFVTFLICFFPVLISMMAGLRSVNSDMRLLLVSMGANKAEVFRKLEWPSSLPSLFAGLKVSVTLAVVGAVVAEFVGASRGLGYILLQANSNLDTALLFAVIILLTIVGLALYYLVEGLERIAVPWHVAGGTAPRSI